MRKYHAQPKFANDTTKQCSEEYANNNSNLGGKTDERPYLSLLRLILENNCSSQAAKMIRLLWLDYSILLIIGYFINGRYSSPRTVLVPGVVRPPRIPIPLGYESDVYNSVGLYSLLHRELRKELCKVVSYSRSRSFNQSKAHTQFPIPNCYTVVKYGRPDQSI